MTWRGSWRIRRLAVFIDFRKREIGRTGPSSNSPYLWRVFFGPLCVAWLRADWDNPIVLPRQARRRLQMGKTVHVSGLEHRRRRARGAR